MEPSRQLQDHKNLGLHSRLFVAQQIAAILDFLECPVEVVLCCQPIDLGLAQRQTQARDFRGPCGCLTANASAASKGIVKLVLLSQLFHPGDHSGPVIITILHYRRRLRGEQVAGVAGVNSPSSSRRRCRRLSTIGPLPPTPAISLHASFPIIIMPWVGVRRRFDANIVIGRRIAARRPRFQRLLLVWLQRSVMCRRLPDRPGIRFQHRLGHRGTSRRRLLRFDSRQVVRRHCLPRLSFPSRGFGRHRFGEANRLLQFLIELHATAKPMLRLLWPA